MENIEKQPEQAKQPARVLWLSDFGCITGFAQVAHNICSQLLRTNNYQIDVIGINYYGMPNDWMNYYPNIRLLPAAHISRGDLFGRQGFLDLLGSGRYDLAFTLQDTFNMEPIAQKIIETRNALLSQNQKGFKWIYYYPIDARPKENWIRNAAALADYPVSYTEYGKRESLSFVPEMASKIRVIPHGIEPSNFHKIDDKELLKKFRSEFFVGNADGKFLVTNVNRNQPRKDMARTMQIFRLFKNQVPEALLYLHMNAYDVAYNLHEVARNFDLIPDKDYIIPKNFREDVGTSTDILNAIYNVSDLIMTTTLGEGWGLSITEAMAAGTPVIAPNHTSLTEMIGEDRGTLVTAGKRISDWVVLSMDNERLRPLVDVAEYVDKMVKIRNDRKEALRLSNNAYEYVHKNLTWDIVGKKWVSLFEEALIPKKKITIGRNDPCWCGSGKKYKHCHYESER